MDALARHRVLALAGVIAPRVEYRDVEELADDIEELDEAVEVEDEDLDEEDEDEDEEEDLEDDSGDEDEELDDEDEADEVEPARSAADRDRLIRLLPAHEFRMTQSDNTSTVGGKSQNQPKQDSSKHPHVASGPKGGQFTSKGGGGSKAAPTPKAKAPGPSTASPPVPQPPTTARTMRPGDSGEDVRYAQYAMSLLGFHVNQNGSYDDQTAAAVKEIQSRLGMAKPNGHLSAAQLHKLQDAVRLSPCVGQSRSFGQDLGETRDLDDVETRHRELVLLGIPVLPLPPDDDNTIDDDTRAILDVLDEWVERQVDEDWEARGDVSKELRIPGHHAGGGRWTKNPLTQAISDALDAWGKGNGPDDPFVFDGKPIDREPLRRAAVARGITLKRGASRDDIVKALLGGVKDEVVAARTERQKRRSGAKFSIDVGGKVDAKAAREVEVENKIRAAYRDLRPGSGYVELTHLRQHPELHGIPRSEQDAALMRMRDLEGINLAPHDLKPLTARDHANALDVGHGTGRDGRHMIWIADPSPRPMPRPVGGKRVDVAVYTGADPNKPTLREISSANRPGRVITTQDDLAGLEKWANDNGHTDVADWAKSERARAEAKNAPKTHQTDTGGQITQEEAGRRMFGTGPAKKAAPAKKAPAKKAAGTKTHPTDTGGRISEADAAKVMFGDAPAKKAATKAAPSGAGKVSAKQQAELAFLDDALKRGESVPGFDEKVIGRGSPREMLSAARDDIASGKLGDAQAVDRVDQVMNSFAIQAMASSMGRSAGGRGREEPPSIQFTRQLNAERVAARDAKAATKAAKAAQKAPSEPKVATKRVPKAAKAAPKPTVGETTAKLASVSTRKEGREALGGLNVADLKAVAKDLQVDSAGANKAQLAERIVEATVGVRADARATKALAEHGRSPLETPSAPHPDGLDSLKEARLKSYAAEFLDSTSGMSDEQIRAALRAQGVGSPEVEQAKRIAEAAAAPKVETPKVPSNPLAPRGPELSHDPEVRLVQVQNRIREAYAALLDRKTYKQNRWVGFADLRAELGSDISRQELDHALIEMTRWDGNGTRPVLIAPESNQKMLTQAERDASLSIGNQPKHIIQIEDPSLKPLPAGGARPKAEGRTAIRSSAPDEPHHYKHGWIPIDPLADLKAAVASGEIGRDHLGGGRMAETSYVYYRNGTDGVHKKLGDVSDVMGAGYDAARQADAEERAAQLGQAIEAPVVKVLRTAPDEIVMDVADGISAGKIRRRITDAAKTNADYASANDRELEEIARASSTVEGIRLGTFDVLTGNWDRQPDMNWNLTDAGTPVGYDHSFAFDGLDSGDFDANTPGTAGDPPNANSIGPFAAHFVKILPDGTTAWDDNPLSPADIDWLRARLASLEDDWTAAGRHDWWQFASDRLEAIAPHATGTESRFAT